MLEIATPADDPNQIIDPPKPTAYASPPQSYPPCLSASAVSGMLSNTADKKPRHSAVCEEASGNRSNGIIDAISTSESRKMELRNARGGTSQSGRRIPKDMRMAIQTATPMNGKRSVCSGNFVFTITFAASARIRINPTIPIRAQSHIGEFVSVPENGRIFVLLDGRWNTENKQRRRGSNARVEDLDR